MKKRIIQGKIFKVSYVKRGANRLPALLKSDGTLELSPITKFDDERGELLCVVYAPETRDSQGHIASADVVKDMCHGYARDGEGLDIQHDGQTLTKEQAYVAENFLVQPGDPRFAGFTDDLGRSVDVTGGWAQVHKIDDENIRESFRKGDLSQVSLQGEGVLEDDDEMNKEAIESILTAFISKLDPSPTPSGDIDMDATELQTMLAKSNTELVASLSEAISEQLNKSAEPGDAPEADEAPKFTGDPLLKSDVQAHQKALAAHAILSKVDWDSPASVSAYLATLTKEDDNADQGREGGDPVGSDADEAEGLSKADAEIERLEAQLKKARGASNQSGGEHADGRTWLSKEQRLQETLGLEMAEMVNAGA
jgi:hypothetical protein